MSATRVAAYRITNGDLEQVLDIATAPGGISGLYQGLPGFEHFAVIDTGDDTFVSLTRWGSTSAAEAAADAAAGWVKEHLSDRIVLASHFLGEVSYEVGA